MVDIANYRFNDPGRAFDEGYGRVNALRTDRARMTAGNALSGGDYGGAANALYSAGELEAGSRVQGMGESRQAAAAKATKDRETEVLDFTGEMAGRLSTILDESQDDPNAAVGAFDTFFAPRLMQMGETPDEIAQVRQQLAGNARQTLLALGAGAAKALGYDTSVVGEELFVVDKATGKLVNRFRGARTVNVGEGGALYEIPGQYGEGGQAAPVETGGAVAPGSTSGDPLFEGMVQQESGGRAGVLGPPTKYGRAEGRTQMLPATAESMARKLGVPWRPDLMRGETPAAAAYQDKLGRAYLDEGLEKYGGDPEKALMYYHGGPDESLWGPKTRAYASSIMGKVGPQLQGGGGQDQLVGGGEAAPGGPRLLVSRPKAAKEAARPATAAEKAAYGIPEKVAAQVKPDGSIDVINLPKGTADIEKAERGQEMQIAKARDIIATAESAISNIGAGESGFVGAKMSEVPGTKAYDVARQIETIKANLGFQELQAMREASPTGGALGAIAVQELVALQSTVANLDIGQSEDQIKANLNKINSHYQRWLNAVEGAVPASGGASAAGASKRMRFDAQGNVIR